MDPKKKTLLLFGIGTAFALLAYLQTHPPLARWPLVILESATFGAGLAFVAAAWPAMRDSTSDVRSARLAYVSAAYVLLTWALADTLVLHTGFAPLDFVFDEHFHHASLVVAGAGIAQYVARLVRERAEGRAPRVA